MKERNYEVLATCLADIESGMDLEKCLLRFPDRADELRPLIETAQLARSISEDHISNSAMLRSRARLMGKAVQLRARRQPRILFGRLPRLAFVALALALAVFLTWQGLLVASAQALPGDSLYPVKLTAEDISLRIASSAEAKRAITARLEQRRVDEVAELLVMGRIVKVQFEGLLAKQTSDRWNVNDLSVVLTPQTRIVGDPTDGTVVKVVGSTQAGGFVVADTISLHSYEFTGQVESIGRSSWVISGVELQILNTSQIDQAARVGDQVIVLVQVEEGAPLRALAILRLLQPALLSPIIQTNTEQTVTEFSGQVEKMSADSWTIGGQAVFITGDTDFKDTIFVGDYVTVHAIISADGSLTATEIRINPDLQTGGSEQTSNDGKEGQSSGDDDSQSGGDEASGDNEGDQVTDDNSQDSDDQNKDSQEISPGDEDRDHSGDSSSGGEDSKDGEKSEEEGGSNDEKKPADSDDDEGDFGGGGGDSCDDKDSSGDDSCDDGGDSGDDGDNSGDDSGGEDDDDDHDDPDDPDGQNSAIFNSGVKIAWLVPEIV